MPPLLKPVVALAYTIVSLSRRCCSRALGVNRLEVTVRSPPKGLSRKVLKSITFPRDVPCCLSCDCRAPSSSEVRSANCQVSSPNTALLRVVES